jgi:hypothetical protein
MHPGLTSLESALGKFGYETQSFVGNPTILPMWGIGTKFDRVLNLATNVHVKADDGKVIDAIIPAIKNAAGRPWFVYAHLIGPHDPYPVRDVFTAKFKTPGAVSSAPPGDKQILMDQYDAEIGYTDSHIGRLMDELRKQGLFDNTLIIFMADHGEQFYEHGLYGHGVTLHREETRIPLFVKLPKSAHAGESCDELMEVVDIAPTILSLVGAPEEPRFQGKSFKDAIDGKPLEQAFAYASLQLEKHSVYMAQSKKGKFIHDLVSQKKTWFNLETDPYELQPIYAANAESVPDARALTAYAAQVAALASRGLNIMITTGKGDVGVVSGRVYGKGVKEGVLHYREGYYDLKEEPESVSFTIRFKEGRSFGAGSNFWYDTVEQDSARIALVVDGSAQVTLELMADGKPVPPTDIFMGGMAQKRHPDSNTLKPLDFVADPKEFEPVLLERRFAVYVWYVPEEQQIKVEEWDPAVREAMKSLGYLN